MRGLFIGSGGFAGFRRGNGEVGGFLQKSSLTLNRFYPMGKIDFSRNPTQKAYLMCKTHPKLLSAGCCALFVMTCIAVSGSGRVLAEQDASPVSYERDVRPIFKAHCLHCHGEESELRGGLDLRLRRLMLVGGDSGPAIVAGDADESLLLDYVSTGLMPPKEEEQISPEEVATLRAWIEQGAPIAETEPEQDPVPGELFITSAERSHWAYRPIEKPELPQLSGGAPSDNPLDAFIAARLESAGLSFNPEADRVTLIRRATFDLTGLPPTPEETQAFVEDDSADAYEKMIERLLASPHYGERWGRHWLDAAGYADSEGFDDKDPVRDDAWHFRDYVIRSFNADKPWDRFIQEQLAGDEIAQATMQNAEGLANKSEEIRELLIATGYLRMAPDGTGSKPMNLDEAKNMVITETIKIISSSLLATTVACAECHHHRFDPVAQEDFYRLRALLAPVYNTESWRMPVARRIAILSPEERQKAEEIEAQAKELEEQRNASKQEVVDIVLERVLETIPEDQREFARETYLTPAKERTKEQEHFLQEQFPMLGLLHPNRLHLYLSRFKDGNDLKKGYEELEEQIAELRKQKPQPELVRVACEIPQQIPATHLFHRGDFNSPVGDPIEPGELALFSDLYQQFREQDAADDKLPTTGRRISYARFLTSGQHPLVARVLMNRFWHHRFGRGIVESTGDFGLQGARPSHPELLDWLAAEFMERGWSLKEMHRLMLTSRTYRQSSRRHAEGDAVDEENRLLWRMPVQRLEAESIRDAILFVSGLMNAEMFGPPIPVGTNPGGVIEVGSGKVSESQRELMRTVYVQIRRTTPVAMLQAFDAPQMEPNCERRVVSTVATQSLALLNSDFVLAQAQACAARVRQQAGESSTPENWVEHLWQLAYSRAPRAEEQSAAVAYLETQTQDFTERKVKQPAETALASLCQILFSSNEFLYID